MGERGGAVSSRYGSGGGSERRERICMMDDYDSHSHCW